MLRWKPYDKKVDIMFDKFTDHARSAVTLAQNEARELRHSCLGTEDLLIALMLLEDEMPARALRKLGVPIETARKNVEKLQIPTETQAFRGDVPFTDNAKKCLESALREALQLGHDYIGTEHLLLGIIRHDSNAVISVYNVYPGTVRQAVVTLMSEQYIATKIAATQPEEPSVRSSADILFDISLQEDHLEQLREELAEAQKRETGIDPSYQH